MGKRDHHIAVQGFTMVELLVAAAITIIVVGGAFALWFMTQDTWVNERRKSEILQELQVAIERMKREIQLSDGGQTAFHTGLDGSYDAISLPVALDDGRSDTGYTPSEDGDGFLEHDSTTLDPITGVSKIYWDKTVIYHVYDNGSEDELRRTDFYPRDNSLSTAQRQSQVDAVVSLGTGNDPTILNNANWQNTRTIFKGNAISFEVAPKLREFDGYSSTTQKTENLVDFGSAILSGGYHTLQFKVKGRNASSSGYALGIDSLKFTPPGSAREGENYVNLTHPDGSAGISASSGDTVSGVNMHDSPFGLWSADYYMNYAANAVNDYVTMRFYYDRWYETTFLDGVSNNVVAEFSNTNGRGGASGNEEWQLRLEGNQATWYALTQTQAAAAEELTMSPLAGDGDITYRNLITANYSQANGMMVSIKFVAGPTYPLTIQSAHIIQRDDSGGAADDGSSNMPSIPITFDSCDVDPRNLGQAGGAPTGSGNSVTIPANCYAWSNWIQLYDNTGTNFNFDKTEDYFISYYIPAVVVDESVSVWKDTSSSPDTHSYYRTGGDYADDIVWAGSGMTSTWIYGVEEVDVTYVDAGTFNSQIFDTAVADPSYGTLKWTAVINNPDATLVLRVRSSDSDAALGADGDWTTITGQSFTISSGSGTAAITSVGTGRYVQFRAELASFESDEDTGHITHDADAGDDYDDDEDYDISCVLKDVSIYWPGNTTMVDVAGHFTKKADYGIFAIEIDGEELTKGFVLTLDIEGQLTRGNTIKRSIAAEVEPRNTNK